MAERGCTAFTGGWSTYRYRARRVRALLRARVRRELRERGASRPRARRVLGETPSRLTSSRLQSVAPNSPVVIVGTHYDLLKKRGFSAGYLADLQREIDSCFLSPKEPDKLGECLLRGRGAATHLRSGVVGRRASFLQVRAADPLPQRGSSLSLAR